MRATNTSPTLVATNTCIYTAERTRPAQSNFLKVRGQSNKKIASNRSLNSQRMDSYSCIESNEYQFHGNIIYLLGENTCQHRGSNLQKFTGKTEKCEPESRMGKRPVQQLYLCHVPHFSLALLLLEALQKWKHSQLCFCWALSWVLTRPLPGVPPVTRGLWRTTTATASMRARRTFDKLMEAWRITFGKGRAVRLSVTAISRNCSAVQSKVTFNIIETCRVLYSHPLYFHHFTVSTGGISCHYKETHYLRWYEAISRYNQLPSTLAVFNPCFSGPHLGHA